MFDGTWGDDIIDTRDVLEWIDGQDEDALDEESEDYDADLAAQVAELREVLEEIEGCTGEPAKYGTTLIHERYFKDYAMELADDIGAIDRNASWPLDCIDWERAARELQMDYTSVDIDGHSYWVC